MEERGNLARRQGNLETILTGITGTRHQGVADARRVERLEGLRCGTPRGAGSPDLFAGAGPLDSDHRQIAAGLYVDMETPGGSHSAHPRDVLVSAARVDHQTKFGGRKEVDDQVVDDAALWIEHARIKRLARGGQARNIVCQQQTQVRRRVGTRHIDVQHVRNVENAGIPTHSVVLFNLGSVVDRHGPAAKVNHPGSGGKMDFSQGGLFQCSRRHRALREG